MYLSVMHLCSKAFRGGPSAFESQWHHWTVKRSLCSMTVLTGGVHLPLVSVSLYMHWYFLIFSYWTVKRSLCSMTVLTGGSICLWCLYLYICTGISLYFLIEQWRDHSVLWQCWWGSICLWCLYLYICTGISLYFLIEQWRDYSVLWQCWWGGPSAFGVCIFIYALVFLIFFLLNSEEITLCYDSVGGGSICLWCLYLYICTGITLCYDSVAWGVHLPLVSVSLYMHWYFLIFSYWMVRRSLCAMTVLTGGSSAFESQWHHWTVKRSLCALTVLMGGSSAFESQWHHWTVKRSLCALTVLTRGVHLPLVSVSLYMHWYFLIFSYWMVKRSLCAMTVLTGGSLPLSLNDTIEQ